MADWFRFPNEVDWDPLVERFPLAGLRFQAFESKSLVEEAPEFPSRIKILDWLQDYDERLFKLQFGYFMTAYYIKLGINDQRTSSLSAAGGTLLLPDVSENQHMHRFQFFYHADAFFHCYFALLDIVGQIINVRLDLQQRFDCLTFEKVVQKIPNSHKQLKASLNAIKSEASYTRAKKHRDRWTHRESPAGSGHSVRVEDRSHPYIEGIPGRKKSPDGITKYVFRTEELTRSGDVKKDIDSCIELLVRCKSAVCTLLV